MLKFNRFPPEPGEIEFDETFVDFMYMAGEQDAEKRYKELGKQVGSILLSNMRPESQVKVFEAAMSLITSTKHAFKDSPTACDLDNHFLYGVVDAIAETINYEESGEPHE